MAFDTVLFRSLVSGTVATVTSSVALTLLARAEGKAALQPINAASHWLYGDRAALVRRPSVDHTTVGLTTHHAATIFWALFFETSLAVRPARGAPALAVRGAEIAALAAIVDFTVTPKRFTPGWELVLSKGAMAAAYAALAAGFWVTASMRTR